MKTVQSAPRPVFFQTVVTKKNFPVLESYTRDIASLKNVIGVVFSIYIPQKNDPSDLWFALSERDRLIEKLLALKDKHGEFILIPQRALELMFSDSCGDVVNNCDMKVNSLALDYRLRRRFPCCYGENVDCELCAVPTPFIIHAKAEAKLTGKPNFSEAAPFPYNLKLSDKC